MRWHTLEADVVHQMNDDQTLRPIMERVDPRILENFSPPCLSVEERIVMATRCLDSDAIPKIPDAGAVRSQPDGTRVQIMNNGLKMLADGYYGEWMTRLIELCRGHHEPQEESVFNELVSRLPPAATMLELGGYRAYYSLWFLHQWPHRRAIVVEPDPAHRAIGESNAKLNELTPEFVSGFIGRHPAPPMPFRTEDSGEILLPRLSVHQLLDVHRIDRLDVLHCDAQGVELDILESCEDLFRRGRIHWVFVSTHAHQISGDPLTHQRCLAALRNAGGLIEVEHDVHESFSGDGLIVARFGPVPAGWPRISISRNRYSESLFRNPLYDLAVAMSESSLDARRLRAELDAVYRSTSWRLTAPLRAINRNYPISAPIYRYAGKLRRGVTRILGLRNQ